MSSGAVEPGRQEAQRHALGSLLARFTADRDALLASIQGCQERIADLVVRLDSGAAPAGATDERRSAPPTGVLELRNALEQLRAEQEVALGRVRADAAQAMDRADAALGAALGAVQQTTPGADELAELRSGIERLEREIAGMRAGSGQPPAAAAGHGDDRPAPSEPTEALAAMAAEIATLRDAIAALGAEGAAPGAGGDVEAVRAAVDQLRAEVARGETKMRERLDAAVRNAASAWDASLAGLRTQLGSAPATGTGTGAAPAALDVEPLRAGLAVAGARIEALAAAVAETQARPDGVADVRAMIEQVRDDLTGMESKMGHYVEATMRTAAEGRDAELANLREQIEKLTKRFAAPQPPAEDAGRVAAAIADVRNDVARVETALTDRLEARLRFATDGWDQETRALREEVRRLAEGQTREAPLAAALAETRAAVQELRSELLRTEAAVDERVDARLRAATGGWGDEARLLREQLARLTAGQAEQASLASGVREIRTAVENVRADVRRLETTIDHRLEAPLRAVSGWDTEADALRERIEALAAQLAEARARAEHSPGLREAFAQLEARLPGLRAVLRRLPGVRLASSVLAAVLRMATPTTSPVAPGS